MLETNIERFIEIQEKNYPLALQEIKNGRKLSHWMWYIFPQIHGLGYSDISKKYEIKNICEAIDYINNDYLYNNLINMCEELLKLPTNNSIEIFGNVDSMKLKSSMTLFDKVISSEFENKMHIKDYNHNKVNREETDIFKKVLDKFFDSKEDSKSIEIMDKELYFIGIQDEILATIDKSIYSKALDLLLRYSEIAPIAIDALGEFDGICPENREKRIAFYKNMTDDEFELFCQFDLDGIIDTAKKYRNS